MAQDSVNTVQSLGNVTRKPELRYTSKGTPFTRFSIACNYPYKDQVTGEWKSGCRYVPVIAWRRLAEVAAEYLDKGSRIFASSHVETNSWLKDEKKQYHTDIVLEKLLFLDRTMPEADYKEAPATAEEVAESTDIPF